MLSRHLSAARHFQAAHFDYFPEQQIEIPAGGGRRRRVTWVERMGIYRADIEAHQASDEDDVILATVLAIAHHELM